MPTPEIPHWLPGAIVAVFIVGGAFLLAAGVL